MIQTVATILFLLLAASGVAVIAASLIDEWDAFRHALGLGVGIVPVAVSPQVRVVATRRMWVVRVSRAATLRAAA